MKRYLLLALLYVPAAHAVSYTAYQNFCQLGGKTVATSGITSKTKVQASYPLCTVSVYAVGTTTLVTIYGDALGNIKPNPFTANVDGSFLFYADANIYPLDVTISAAGISPPFTYKAVLGGGGGGTSGCDPANTVCSTNGLVGAVVLAGGANTTIVPSGNTLTISSSGGGGGSGPALQYQSAYFDTTTSIKGTQLGLPVAAFGALCDGTTDDTAALQTAFDYAYDNTFSYASGQTFPIYALSFPSGTCKITSPIVYRGESFYGVSLNQSFIKQATAKMDVFAAPDAADSPARRCCFTGTRVHDIALLFDANSDANGTALWAAKGRGAGQGSVFANTFAGWSGQTVKGSLTSGATTIPLTTATTLTNYHLGYANTGWIKIGTEFISYQGITDTACPSSAPLCLLNATRGITLAGTASAAAAHSDGDAVTPVNPLDPGNVADWIPAFTVGACGFSFPQRNGAVGGVTPPFMHGSIDHVRISGVYSGSFPTGNQCMFYIQGSFYSGHMDYIYGGATAFGVVIAPPFFDTDSFLVTGLSSDDMGFSHFDINVSNPFISYIGGRSTFIDDAFYAGGSPGVPSHGITLHTTSCHTFGTCVGSSINSFSFVGLYQEVNNGSGAVTEYPPMAQIAGSGHSFLGTQMGGPNSVGAPIVWDASQSIVTNMAMGSGTPTLQINGNSNIFSGIGNPDSTSAAYVDNGYGNYVSLSSTHYGLRPINAYPTRDAASQLAPDFLARGAVSGDWFQSLQDLFLTPDDLNNNTAIQTTGTSVVNDTAVPITGRYIPIPSPGTISNHVSADGVGMVIGQRFPKGTGTFYVALKAGAGTTQTWTIHCQSGSIGSATLTLTTSWAVYPIRYDSTGGACPINGSGGWATAAATSAVTTIQLGWEAFVPDFTQLTVSGIMNSALSTPASASATCTTGDWAHDTGFIYTCTAPNTWERVPISTW